MANITAADVKRLRDMTQAGMMECKKALTETDGDFEAAVDLLRTKGAAKAAARAGERPRTASPSLRSQVGFGWGAFGMPPRPDSSPGRRRRNASGWHRQARTNRPIVD